MSLLGNKLFAPFAKLLIPLVVVGLFFLATSDIAFADGPNAVEEFVFTFVISAFGTLVMAAGSMLDNSIEYFILEFATLYRTNFGGAIELSWAVIRDLMNFALIFGLVYVGFRFILNADEAGAKRNLVTLILAALLVNFSLFFAKFIVDISNIAGASFAEAIGSGDTLGISSSFAELLGLTTSFNPQDALDAAEAAEMSFWGIIAMTLVTLLVAAFVFAAAAILIMIRFIVLSFMLVFSPIVVLGWIFPFFQGLSRKWLNTFLGQAFMAPAMFLMLYCSFLILNGLGGAVSAGETIAEGGSFTGTLSVVPFYILGMGFLIGSLIVAQKMGAAGAATAISIGEGARRRTTGWAARNTVGRAASKSLDAQKSNNRAVRTFGRAASIATLGNRNLESIRGNKFGGSYSRADDEKYAKEQATRNSQIKTNNQSLTEIKAGLKALKTDESRRTTAQKETIETMYSTVAALNQKQLEDLGDSDKATLKSIAPLMNADQADKFAGNNDVDPSLRNEVQKARQTAWRNLVEKNGKVITSELTKLNTSQLEELGGEFINANSHQFSGTQVEDLMKSKKLSDAQKQNLQANRKTKQVAWVQSGQAGAKRLFNTYNEAGAVKGRYKPKDVAKLDRDVLLNDNAIPNLTANDLEAIAEQKTLPTNDREQLKRKIVAQSQNQNLDPQTRSNMQQLAGYFNTPHAQEKW